jgi:hypothetical protein
VEYTLVRELTHLHLSSQACLVVASLVDVQSALAVCPFATCHIYIYMLYNTHRLALQQRWSVCFMACECSRCPSALLDVCVASYRAGLGCMLALGTSCVEWESTQQVRLIMFTPASSPRDGANCQLPNALHCRKVSGVVDCLWLTECRSGTSTSYIVRCCAVRLADSAVCEPVVLLYLSCFVIAACWMHISAVRVCFVRGASFHVAFLASLAEVGPSSVVVMWSVPCTCFFWRCAAVCAAG